MFQTKTHDGNNCPATSSGLTSTIAFNNCQASPVDADTLSAALLTAAEALNYVMLREKSERSTVHTTPDTVRTAGKVTPPDDSKSESISEVCKNLSALKLSDLQALKVLHGLAAHDSNYELAAEIVEARERSMRAFYQLPWDAPETELAKAVRISNGKAQQASSCTIPEKSSGDLWMRGKYGLSPRASESQVRAAIKLSALRCELARYKLPEHATEEDVIEILNCRVREASKYAGLES
jgi:hypothetical protein